MNSQSKIISLLFSVTFTACGFEGPPDQPDLGCVEDFNLVGTPTAMNANYTGNVSQCSGYLGSDTVDESQVSVSSITEDKDGKYTAVTLSQTTISATEVSVSLTFSNPTAEQLANIWSRDDSKIRDVKYASASEVAPAKLKINFSRE